jgi:hypothetical protein
MVAKPKGDSLMEALEAAVRRILSNPKASKKEKNDAIANGIKLAQIKHRLSPDATEEFFGTGS